MTGQTRTTASAQAHSGDPGRDAAERQGRAVRAAAETAALGYSLLAASLDAHVADLRDPSVADVVASVRRRLDVLMRATMRAADAADGRTVDLGALLRDTAMRHATPCRDTGRPIDLSVGTDDVRIPAEIAIPMLLVADELVRNAFRYAFRGRTTGLVRVDLRIRGGNLLLTVRDDGIGISEKTLLSKGCGLGLMHELIQRIGGTVFIWREVGTSALVSVPLHPATVDREVAP